MHNNAVEWYCSDDVHRTIVCLTNDIDVQPITCHDQTLTAKSHDCYDGTITSLVEVNISSHSTTWICMMPQDPSINGSITVTMEGKFPL